MSPPALRPVQTAYARVRAVLVPEEMERAERILRGQWPKHCACGRDYYPAGSRVPQWWSDLKRRYQRTDEYGTSEARDCLCGSTLEIYLCIHDPSLEGV